MTSIFKVTSFCDLLLIIISSIIFVLVTIMFCFWCIYILDAMRRKWKFYRNLSNCLLERNGSNQEEIMAYNAETEYVKYIFLFFINLLEWATVVCMAFNFIPNLVLQYKIQSLNQRDGGKYFQDDQLLHSMNELYEMKHFLFSLPFLYWGICCIILSWVLIANLCTYLAARQAKLSWMKSNKIPYLIVFFLISLILTQTITEMCPTCILIGDLCYMVLLTFALFHLVHQYRKLLMVINWSIVDLQISGNTHLLGIQVQMKYKFARLFRFLFTGYILMLSAIILGFVIQIGLIFIEQQQSSNNTSTGISYCEVYEVLYLLNLTVGLTGSVFFFVSYIGFGFSTMCVILWRLINGKTGYKTHFKNPLNTPLI